MYFLIFIVLVQFSVVFGLKFVHKKIFLEDLWSPQTLGVQGTCLTCLIVNPGLRKINTAVKRKRKAAILTDTSERNTLKPQQSKKI